MRGSRHAGAVQQCVQVHEDPGKTEEKIKTLRIKHRQRTASCGDTKETGKWSLCINHTFKQVTGFAVHVLRRSQNTLFMGILLKSTKGAHTAGGGLPGMRFYRNSKRRRPGALNDAISHNRRGDYREKDTYAF